MTPWTVATVVIMTLLETAPLLGGPVCGRHAGRRASVMWCRGGPLMDRQGSPSVADTDLTLHVRGTRTDTVRNGNGLDPGACTWVDRPFVTGRSRLLMVPLNGPLAVEPYPVGHQARACAQNSQCLMEFCAYEDGPIVAVVDGYIRLVFIGRE